MRTGLRWATALLLAATSWTATTTAAEAKTATKTVVSIHVSPSTAYVGSAVVVSGSAKSGAAVALEQLQGKSWRVVAHRKASKVGGYAFTVRAPRTAGTLLFRTVSGSRTTGKISVRVTKAIYHVTSKFGPATVDAGQPIAVSGLVTPKATGSVWVQWLKGKTWVNLTKVLLSQHSTYRGTFTRPAGGIRLRVTKPYNAKIAAGAGKPATVRVLPRLTVATTALPPASIGHVYSAQLSAAGGKPPYTWAYDGVSGGLSLKLSPSGLLTGAPSTIGSGNLPLAVTDALGQRATASVDLRTTPPYGPVEGFGRNDSGGLGDGTLTDRATPVAVPGQVTVTAITANDVTSFALAQDGTVWGWGSNDDNQIDVSPTSLERLPTPQQLPGLTDVVAVAAGGGNGYALREDGTVWAWGGNDNGLLGTGATGTYQPPRPVVGLTDVRSIAAGAQFAMALLENGTVVTWGRNESGELGDGTSKAFSAAPVQVFGLSDIQSIGTVEGATAYAVLTNGHVVAWGSNLHGALGNGSAVAFSASPVAVNGPTGVVAVAGGETDGYALDADGQVWSWGDNYYGQLGVGGGERDTPAPIADLSGVTGISAGTGNGYAVLSDGTVRAWGDNSHGQLGDNRASGASSSAPVTVPGLSGVSSIAAAGQYALVLKAPYVVLPTALTSS